MTRAEWKALWRWMRVEKKRLAWEHGPTQPEAPILVDWGLVAAEWGKPLDWGPPLRLGSCSTAGEAEP